MRSALLAREATAAPAALIEATTRAAMGLGGAASGAKAAGTVSAAVALSDGFLRRMLMIRLIQMTSVLAVAATAGFMAWGSLADGVGPKSLPAGPQAGPVAAAKDDVAGVGPIRGRVLDPGGKPVRDAAIYVGETRSAWLIEPVARTGADGRFTIDLDKVAEKHRSEPFRMDWKRVELTALAPGYGGGWAPTAGSGGGAGSRLRLCPDDVPIRGRVLDTQVTDRLAGVSVRCPGGSAVTRQRSTSIRCFSSGGNRRRAAPPVEDVTTSRLVGQAERDPTGLGGRSRPTPTAGSGSTVRAATGSSPSRLRGRGSGE